MPAARDFLERFRPVGAPGAAAGGGVPADRAGDLAAELESVLALLDDADALAERIRQQARDRAVARRERVAARAEACVQDAVLRSSSVRAEIVAAATKHAEAELADALAEAELAAKRLHHNAEQRLPGCVAKVLAELDLIVRELVEGPR